MRRFPASLVLMVLAFLMLGAYSSALGAFGIQPNHGYVTYQLSLTRAGNPVQVFIVNETGRPTGQDALVQLTLALSTNGRHLAYSKIVNSSSLPEIFPYLPQLNNQSLSYSSHGISITAKIIRSGTVPVTFKGGTYTALKYALSISLSRSVGTNYSTIGNIVTMPSGLVYSIQLGSNQPNLPYALNVTLVATNLPLTDPAGTTTMFGFALVGLGLAGAVGLAVPSVFAFVRTKTVTRNKPSIPTEPSKDQDKPSHWVD